MPEPKGTAPMDGIHESTGAPRNAPCPECGGSGVRVIEGMPDMECPCLARARQSAPKSADLEPGTKVRFKPSGNVYVLGRRKQRSDFGPFEQSYFRPGWWLTEATGLGLADSVIDGDERYEVLGG